MRKKITLVGVLALFLLAAVPGMAFAKTRLFTATAELTQLPGALPTLGVTLESAAADEPALAALVASIPLGIPGGTPGVLTLGQPFEGAIGTDTLPVLKNADIDAVQNSWFTFLADPFATPLVPVAIIGYAWGSFDLSNGNGNSMIGGYGAVLTGTFLAADPACGYGPSVIVSDFGGWNPVAAHGALTKLSPNPVGPAPFGFPTSLVVTASGCIGAEEAVVTIYGASD